MDFTKSTIDVARMRQLGHCALCNENLDWMEENAHHIHPNALGGPDRAENCVVLCRTCHTRVHNDGNFRSGIVAPLDYFPYSG